MHNYTDIKFTERLLIRPLEMADIDKWAVYLADEQVTRYYPDLMKSDIGNWADKWIKKALQRYAEGSFGLMGLIENQAVVSLANVDC